MGTIKLTISEEDLKCLLSCKETRDAALHMIDKAKVSKYCYTGSPSDSGVYYYCEMEHKAVNKLRLLIFGDECADTLINKLNILFIVQLIKKLNKGGE